MKKVEFKLNKKSKWFLFVYSIIIITTVIFSYLPSLVLNKFSQDSQFDVIIKVSLFFLGILISRSLMNLWASWMEEKCKTIVEREMKDRVIKIFIKQNFYILENTNTETLAFSTFVNIRNYVEAKVRIIEGLSFSITAFIYTFIFIGIQSWILLLFVLFAILVWIISSNIFNPKMREKNKIMRKQEEEYTINFSRLFKNATVSILLNQESFLLEKIEKVAKEYNVTKNQYAKIKSFSVALWHFLFALTQLGMILLAFWLTRESQQWMSGSIKPESFNSIIYLSGMLLGPIFRIGNIIHDINLQNSSFKQLKEKTKDWNALALPKELIEIEEIHFNNVGMKRKDISKEEYLFENINEIIQKGDFVKIEAPSGGGKTTLISLLFNHQKPDIGTITFNNKIDSSENVFFNAGLIKQQASIFPLSIEENIFLNKEKNDELLLSVLSQVGLKYLFQRKNEVINLNQTNLSGGELRRIEIARLLLFKPSILILDEAFVGIDINEKNKIISIIKNEFKNSIIIYTSHEDHIQFNNKVINLNEIHNKR